MSKTVILQARMESSRLPGKVLKPINGKPMIEWQIARIQQSKAEKIILATSNDASDDDLATVVRKLGIEVYRGSLQDVHSRFMAILEKEQPRFFIRLTGDCPLVMPNLIDKMMSKFEIEKFDYFSNINPPTYPDGLDIEIISTEKFFEFSRKDLSNEEKEHVTIGLRRRSGMKRHGNFENRIDLSRMRWTVDYPEDFLFVERVFNFFEGRELYFNMDEILEAIRNGRIKDNLVPHNFRNISLMNGGKVE